MNGVAVEPAEATSTWHFKLGDLERARAPGAPGDGQPPAQAGYRPVLEYIAGFWDRLIRFHPHDTGTLVGLPRPYLVPATDPARPLFQEMYYWDSYFTALGLVGTAHEWLVFDMAENMAALIERFGFVPNANRYYFTSRS